MGRSPRQRRRCESHQRNTRRVCSASFPFCFRAFCGGDPFATGAPAQPVASQLILPQIDSSPPAHLHRSKEAERRSAGSQLQWRLHPATTTHISSRIVQPAGQSFARAGAEPGAPGRRGQEQNNPIPHAARATASGGQWGEASNWAQCCCWAAILGTRQLNRLGLPRIERRSGDGGPAERRCSSSQPQGLPGGRCNTRLFVAGQLGQNQQQGPAPAFRAINNRRTVPQCSSARPRVPFG